MKGVRRFLPLALVLPFAGCVFAVGGDGEGNEKLRDRVRDLEKRVDRLERPHGQVITIQGTPLQTKGGFMIREAEIEEHEIKERDVEEKK